ncbi:hypothetical protein ACJX0J_028563 [Zea mays]
MCKVVLYYNKYLIHCYICLIQIQQRAKDGKNETRFHFLSFQYVGDETKHLCDIFICYTHCMFDFLCKCVICLVTTNLVNILRSDDIRRLHIYSNAERMGSHDSTAGRNNKYRKRHNIHLMHIFKVKSVIL